MNLNLPALQGSFTREPLVTPVVVIVNNDAAVRRNMDSLIRSAGWQVRTFADARTFLHHPRELVPSCLLLGVELPDMGGLDVQALLSDRPEMPVVFTADQADVRTTVRAMKAGAVEFLMTPIGEDVLLNAIQQAFIRSRAALAYELRMRGIRARYASLSRREQEVMAHVISGRLNKLIAKSMEITEVTVKVHRGRVMRKMQAASLPHLVNMATRLGVATPDLLM